MSDDKINLARLKKGGETFEIVVDPDKAMDFKKGRSDALSEVLKSDEIFSDAKRGMLASEARMRSLFDTDDKEQVARIILGEGEVQLSAEYRDRLFQEKKKKIIAIIHSNGVDPKTHLPHPMQRIENALEEAKVRIDPMLPVESQVKDIIAKLRIVLPIKFETKELHLRIPSQHAMKAYQVVKANSDIKKEDWLSDGSWSVTVEIPGGMETDLYDKLNSVCHGDFESKVLGVR